VGRTKSQVNSHAPVHCSEQGAAAHPQCGDSRMVVPSRHPDAMWVVGIIGLSQITVLPGANYSDICIEPYRKLSAGVLFVALHLHAALTWWILISSEASSLSIGSECPTILELNDFVPRS